MSFFSLRIRGRLLSGFAAICVLLAATVGYTAYAISDISGRFKRVVDVRAPVVIASTQLVGNLYSTLSTLRGYLLTGDPQGKQDRAATWAELDRTSAEFDRPAADFTNYENKQMWAEAKTLIGELRAVQARAESVAFTPDAYPATKMLSTEAAPLIAAMFDQITRMIDEEEKLEASPERKRLLKTMADVRGNLAAAGSQLRLYAASGEAADRDKFAAPLANFRAALALLKTNEGLLTATQKTYFEAIAKAEAAFAPMPDRIFALRRSPEWNAPVFILTSEAAPRAARILDLLDGKKDAGGIRAGGIKTNQQAMLAEDTSSVAGRVETLLLSQWILLGLGLGGGGRRRPVSRYRHCATGIGEEFCPGSGGARCNESQYGKGGRGIPRQIDGIARVGGRQRRDHEADRLGPDPNRRRGHAPGRVCSIGFRTDSGQCPDGRRGCRRTHQFDPGNRSPDRPLQFDRALGKHRPTTPVQQRASRLISAPAARPLRSRPGDDAACIPSWAGKRFGASQA